MACQCDLLWWPEGREHTVAAARFSARNSVKSILRGGPGLHIGNGRRVEERGSSREGRTRVGKEIKGRNAGERGKETQEVVESKVHAPLIKNTKVRR